MYTMTAIIVTTTEHKLRPLKVATKTKQLNKAEGYIGSTYLHYDPVVLVGVVPGWSGPHSCRAPGMWACLGPPYVGPPTDAWTTSG